MHADEPASAATPTPSINEHRRSFLRKAAIGGAVAWTAPVILSRPAGATGSCIDTTHAWAAGTSVPSGTVFNDGTTTFTFSFAGGVTLTSGVDTLFSRATVGGTADNYHMQLTGPQAGPEVITMTFSPAISDLVFTVLDIDQQASQPGWIDRILVEASLAGNPVAVVGQQQGTGTTFNGGTDEYTGNTSTPNSEDVNSDVRFVVAGSIDTVTITYSRVGLLLTQGIGISSLVWCELP